jgi:hypothetical protein
MTAKLWIELGVSLFLIVLVVIAWRALKKKEAAAAAPGTPVSAGLNWKAVWGAIFGILLLAVLSGFLVLGWKRQEDTAVIEQRVAEELAKAEAARKPINRPYWYVAEEAPDPGHKYSDSGKYKAVMFNEDQESYSLRTYYETKGLDGKKVTKTCTFLIYKDSRLGRWDQDDPLANGGGNTKLKQQQNITNGFCFEEGNDALPAGVHRDAYFYPAN